MEVSIHAPARGATECICSKAAWASFNPRTREGCDRIFKSALNINMQSYVFCDTTPNY